MAKIVLGLGTSHGPMLSTPPEQWDLRVPFDVANRHPFRDGVYSFDELVALRKDENLQREIGVDVWRTRHAQCRAAIERSAEIFAAARPDVAVIVGNDQMECFSDTLIPAFGVMYGETIVNSEYDATKMANLPVGVAVSVPGHIPPGGATYAAQPALAQHIVARAMDEPFDVAALKRMPGDETPHAYGFVFRQIMRDRPVPTVPVFVNTFYPPNQPKVERCVAFGRFLRRAIESWDSDARVAILCSGGLTHFVVDEALDQAFFTAMRERRIEDMARFGEHTFQAGTSELKNWIPVAAAMADLDVDPEIVDYVPCYRSLAGTGNAMGFVAWRAD